jgi:hypothetical protein
LFWWRFHRQFGKTLAQTVIVKLRGKSFSRQTTLSASPSPIASQEESFVAEFPESANDIAERAEIPDKKAMKALAKHSRKRQASSQERSFRLRGVSAWPSPPVSKSCRSG